MWAQPFKFKVLYRLVLYLILLQRLCKLWPDVYNSSQETSPSSQSILYVYSLNQHQQKNLTNRPSVRVSGWLSWQCKIFSHFESYLDQICTTCFLLLYPVNKSERAVLDSYIVQLPYILSADFCYLSIYCKQIYFIRLFFHI